MKAAEAHSPVTTTSRISLSFRLLRGLLVLRCSRRELLWLGVTTHPTAECIARQWTARGGEPPRPTCVVMALLPRECLAQSPFSDQQARWRGQKTRGEYTKFWRHRRGYGAAHAHHGLPHRGGGERPEPRRYHRRHGHRIDRQRTRTKSCPADVRLGSARAGARDPLCVSIASRA